MKIIQKIAFAVVVASASTVLTAPSHAFMMDAAEATAVANVDLTQTVDELRQELKTGETACKEMLAKIDAAILKVDSALDTGVADEKKFLGLRDELVELRLSLPCLSEELVQADGEIVSDTVVSEQVVGETVVGEGTQDENGRMIAGGRFGGGGGFGGAGGAGGAAGAGIGGLGPLALGGLAAAVAIPAALGGNNNNPGAVASPAK